LCILQAAARNMRSRKEPRQRSSSSAFKALIELGGASAQVTFMPDQQWHGGSSSSSSSKGQESLRLPLPGALLQMQHTVKQFEQQRTHHQATLHVEGCAFGQIMCYASIQRCMARGTAIKNLCP
jgi:hypothetical protein